jgi:hypothetical protein
MASVVRSIDCPGLILDSLKADSTTKRDLDFVWRRVLVLVLIQVLVLVLVFVLVLVLFLVLVLILVGILVVSLCAMDFGFVVLV